jgi:hypothetical protein
MRCRRTPVQGGGVRGVGAHQRSLGRHGARGTPEMGGAARVGADGAEAGHGDGDPGEAALGAGWRCSRWSSGEARADEENDGSMWHAGGLGVELVAGGDWRRRSGRHL